MTPFPQSCVLDASVLIKYIVPEAETKLLIPLMHVLLNDEFGTIHAPDLIYTECANVLWKKFRRKEIDQPIAERALAFLFALDIATIATPSVTPRALQIASQYNISVYDACYLAATEHSGVPFITADMRLVNTLAGTSYQIFALTSYL